MRVPKPDEMIALERLVDFCSLAEVLTALDVICGDKADHVRQAWQDERTARSWDSARAVCMKAAKRAHELAL